MPSSLSSPKSAADKATSLQARLNARARVRVIMVHDQTPVDEETTEPHEPFKLEAMLDDTVGSIKAKILQHKGIAVSDASMQALRLVYNSNELADDEVPLKAHYFARMHGVNGKGFKWSFPYVGIVWITPRAVMPSNAAIAKYTPDAANVIRRAQGDICAAYYSNVESEAERLAKAARGSGDL